MRVLDVEGVFEKVRILTRNSLVTSFPDALRFLRIIIEMEHRTRSS